MPLHTKTNPRDRALDIVLRRYSQSGYNWLEDNETYHQDMILAGQIVMELSNQVADD